MLERNEKSVIKIEGQIQVNEHHADQPTAETR